MQNTSNCMLLPVSLIFEVQQIIKGWKSPNPFLLFSLLNSVEQVNSYRILPLLAWPLWSIPESEEFSSWFFSPSWTVLEDKILKWQQEGWENRQSKDSHLSVTKTPLFFFLSSSLFNLRFIPPLFHNNNMQKLPTSIWKGLLSSYSQQQSFLAWIPWATVVTDTSQSHPQEFTFPDSF